MTRIEDAVLGPSGEYRYNLSTTEDSSHRYGNCEVCDKHTSRDYFGHKECLLGKRR